MDTTNIVKKLENIPAGFLEPNIFNQVARLGVLSYLEVVALRLNGNDVEVLLTRRSEDDPFWPNMYHNPGTVLRPNDADNTFGSALTRLSTDEYSGSIMTNGPFFAGFWFMQLERGKGLGIVSWIELTNCLEGTYFNVNQLPKNIIKGQARYIQKCAQDFTNYKHGTFNPVRLEELILK